MRRILPLACLLGYSISGFASDGENCGYLLGASVRDSMALELKIEPLSGEFRAQGAKMIYYSPSGTRLFDLNYSVDTVTKTLLVKGFTSHRPRRVDLDSASLKPVRDALFFHLLTQLDPKEVSAVRFGLDKSDRDRYFTASFEFTRYATSERAILAEEMDVYGIHQTRWAQIARSLGFSMIRQIDSPEQVSGTVTMFRPIAIRSDPHVH